MNADYTILAVPVTTLRAIEITPDLPAEQTKVFERLKYGRVTKSLLQFDRRFWKAQRTIDCVRHRCADRRHLGRQ